MLNNICKSWSMSDDEFVGLRFIPSDSDVKPEIVFPRGFEIADSEEQIRRDILRLFSVLCKYGNHREGGKNTDPNGTGSISFPMLSYQYIIHDFLLHGYYSEREEKFARQSRGKISWKRTIQQEKPLPSKSGFVYLDFITKVNQINNRNLICKIHEYCVYESFRLLGWLYLENGMMPQRPSIKFNKQVFSSVLTQELGNTFNTTKRHLFQSMLNIVNNSTETISIQSFPSFGVDSFEDVWEDMIDYVFGEDNKEEYFPHAEWHIISRSGFSQESSELKPDTIIKHDGKVYIIDAKYYKYGVTRSTAHLPATDSIQKQITYGDYIAVPGIKNRNIQTDADKIYNAFILPFNCGEGNLNHYEFVGVGTADWIKYDLTTPSYKYILAILMDTRYLMSCCTRKDDKEIETLCSLIETSISHYRTQLGEQHA